MSETLWRKGSEWKPEDGRVLCYDPYFKKSPHHTYAYCVKRCTNPKWLWMPLPQPPSEATPC